MKMNKKSALGLAAVGVLLTVTFAGPAFARVLGRLYGNSLHVENEPRSHTPGRFTIGNNDAFVYGNLEVDGATYLAGQSYAIVPATQVIAAGGTITADACGGLKRISAASDVTTDTTNTLTAPAAANAGCRMLIVNVSATQTIYLDSNTNFALTNVASAALGPLGSIMVVSDGSTWLHQRWTEY